MTLNDYTEEQFGRLTVLRMDKSRNGRAACLCRCDCGNEKVVLAQHLRAGTTVSCGCWRMNKITKHGMTDSPEFSCWQNMIARTSNPKRKGYKNYGGRGISVCERWRSSFASFYADMGSRPSPKHSIDRINNDGNYDPSNCRWATRREQAINRRVTQMYTAHGRTMLLADWSKECGINDGTLRTRIKTGESLEMAMRGPKGQARRKWKSNGAK